MFCEMFNGFSRDFGCPFRIRVYTKNMLDSFIDDNNGVKPCFLSISQYKKDVPYLMFIPFDFDGKTNRVLKDATNLSEYLDKNSIPHFITWTANKGVHVVIRLKFNPDNPKFITPETMRNIQMHMLFECKLETVDYHLIGNINALLRIPQTFNDKSKEITVLLKGCDDSIDVDDLLNKLNVKKYTVAVNGHNENNQKLRHPYPCLECYIRVPNPTNYCRVAFAIMRFHQDKNILDIIDEIETFGWVDWDKNKTLYHLGEIGKREYSMPCCSTVKGYGLCIGCKYDDERIFGKVKRRLTDG